MKEEEKKEFSWQESLDNLPICCRLLDSIDSTNAEARRHALSGGSVPTVILADRQTAGRGRMGRSFYSPRDTGLYLSLLLEAKKEPADSVLLTTAAAVAVARAVARVTGISLGIKWVNDLYLGGKKVCGILAESFSVGAERYVILGVGINLSTEKFPEELESIAGSLGVSKACKPALATELARELLALYDRLHPEDFMEEYRTRSVILGRDIYYTENGVSRRGFAESVDDRGRLQIRHEDGSGHLLAAGEISLRWDEERNEDASCKK